MSEIRKFYVSLFPIQEIQYYGSSPGNLKYCIIDNRKRHPNQCLLKEKKMKKAILILLLVSVFLGCNNDDDDDESNPQYEELVYEGTTNQNREITIKVRGILLTGIKTKFDFMLPMGTTTIAVDLYNSKGIASFSNKSFTYTFPEPSDNQSIKKGSEITGTLETIRIEGEYNISLKDNGFNFHGDYETKLY